MKKTAWNYFFGAAVFLAGSGICFGQDIDCPAVEAGENWQVIQAGRFVAEFGGLTPVSGETFWFGKGPENPPGVKRHRGIYSVFKDTFKPGTLIVSYSVGQPKGFPFSGEISAFLFADVNGDGKHSWDERIENMKSDRSIPQEGQWAVWTDQYAIDETTVTAGGDPVIGQKMGFFFVKVVPASEAFCLDGLSISSR